LVRARAALPRARALLSQAPRGRDSPVLRARADRSRSCTHPRRRAAAWVLAARGTRSGGTMKSLARVQTLPPTLAALERAFATDGASALEPNVPPAVWQRALVDPAADFLARPGKELRSSLVQAGWCIGGGAPDAIPPALPLVIELLHAGSLIIDDV